ncbi:MAG: MucR family transcriptional regulator [Rhodospirillales bacterium]|nr:MucR family transcriptional regulator [Rhodospirillales bacterium]
MGETNKEKANHADLLRMTSQVAAAYVGNNTVPPTDIPEVIKSIFVSIATLDTRGGATSGSHKPMVPIKKSVTPEYIICLEDGKKLKMLKRHLRTAYGLTPEEYRLKWGLPADYPMVAPKYAEQRSAFAKQIGLGRKAGRRAAKTKK